MIGFAVRPHPHPAVDGGAQALAVERDPRLAQLPGLIAAASIGAPVQRAAGRQVVAGAEGAAGALESDHAHVVAGVQLAQRRLEVVAQSARDGVQLLGAVERDRRHRPVDLDEDILILGRRLGHCGFSTWRRRRLRLSLSAEFYLSYSRDTQQLLIPDGRASPRWAVLNLRMYSL